MTIPIAPQPDWAEHAQTIVYVLGGFAAALLSLVSWMMIRAIGKIDTNQTKLFVKYEDFENRLSHIEGAHGARTGMKLSCEIEEVEK